MKLQKLKKTTRIFKEVLDDVTYRLIQLSMKINEYSPFISKFSGYDQYDEIDIIDV